MSLTKNRWFRRTGFAVIATLGLAVSALSSAPAEAHEFGYRAPMTSHHRAAHFPRVFFGFGHHRHHSDYRWR